MKKITTLLIAMLFVSITFAQITSTTTGGNWNETSTWIGAVVPTAADDVVIDGTVYHNSKTDACNNLTVNSGKILTTFNAEMTGIPLKIMGDVINNGNIQNNNNFRFQIGVSGNITNNGVFTNYGIQLNGDENQVFSGNKPFASYFMQTNTANKIIAGTDLIISGTSLLFYKNNEFVIESGKTVSILFSDAQVRGEFMPPTNMAMGIQFTGGGTLKTDGKYSLDGVKTDAVTVLK